jgi:hypothetical protein
MSRRDELWEGLFKQAKMALGVDIKPADDPIEAFCRGDYGLSMMEVVVDFMRCKSKEDDFLMGLPEKLRTYLWDLCSKAIHARTEPKGIRAKEGPNIH